MATFGGSAEAGDEKAAPATPQFTFGAAAAAAPSFGAPADGGSTSTAGEPSLFGAGQPVQKFGEASAPAAATTEDDDAAEHPERQESTQEFTPVVQLEEVEVKTMEEDEEIVFKMRAKLYRFTETLLNKGSGSKEWIERGVGEVKILKHRESERLRVLMRQEKTMKVICNHVVDPRIVLNPNVGNDKSWVWSAYDFSDGELVEEVFAIKFANKENATKYKDAFVSAQDAMTKLLAGEDGPPDAEADATADALGALKATDDAAAGEEPAPEEAAAAAEAAAPAAAEEEPAAA